MDMVRDMVADTQLLITATSEREAVGQLVREHSEVIERNRQLEAANKELRRQLSVAMQRIQLLETEKE